MKSVEQSVNFEKCTFEKIKFKVFEGYKDKKNSYLCTAYTNLAETWLWNVWSVRVLFLRSSFKYIEQTVIFCSSIWRLQHFKNILFCEFLTQFGPISGPVIAFLQAAAEINNKDTLKVRRKITIITDPNLGFFLAMGRIRGWNSQ